jgi:vacuolar protein sorting-associated protein IST1
MLSYLGFGYQEKKLKPNLKMACSRMRIIGSKKTEKVKAGKKDIARMLGDDKTEKARIAAEGIIREDFTVEAFEVLDMMCELCHERTRYISSSTECPEDIKKAVQTLVWAANKVEIPELEVIRSQFQSKYGKEFCEEALENKSDLEGKTPVNERVCNKVSVPIPIVWVFLSSSSSSSSSSSFSFSFSPPQEYTSTTQPDKCFRPFAFPLLFRVQSSPKSSRQPFVRSSTVRHPPARLWRITSR